MNASPWNECHSLECVGKEIGGRGGGMIATTSAEKANSEQGTNCFLHFSLGLVALRKYVLGQRVLTATEMRTSVPGASDYVCLHATGTSGSSPGARLRFTKESEHKGFRTYFVLRFSTLAKMAVAPLFWATCSCLRSRSK